MTDFTNLWCKIVFWLLYASKKSNTVEHIHFYKENMDNKTPKGGSRFQREARELATDMRQYQGTKNSVTVTQHG